MDYYISSCSISSTVMGGPLEVSQARDPLLDLRFLFRWSAFLPWKAIFKTLSSGALSRLVTTTKVFVSRSVIRALVVFEAVAAPHDIVPLSSGKQC